MSSFQARHRGCIFTEKSKKQWVYVAEERISKMENTFDEIMYNAAY